MLILTIAHLYITLDHFFFLFLFNFIHFTFVLVTWSLRLFVCGFRKGNLCGCEDRVKANYFLLIPSQREPQIDYEIAKRSTTLNHNGSFHRVDKCISSP